MIKTVNIPDDSEDKFQLKKRSHFKRVRLFVIILSVILFVICLYDIYVSFTSTTTDVPLEDILWRFRTIVRTAVSLLGYIGTILCHKRLLVAVMALIMADLTLTFGVYYITYDKSKCRAIISSDLTQIGWHSDRSIPRISSIFGKCLYPERIQRHWLRLHQDIPSKSHRKPYCRQFLCLLCRSDNHFHPQPRKPGVSASDSTETAPQMASDRSQCLPFAFVGSYVLVEEFQKWPQDWNHWEEGIRLYITLDSIGVHIFNDRNPLSFCSIADRNERQVFHKLLHFDGHVIDSLGFDQIPRHYS